MAFSRAFGFVSEFSFQTPGMRRTRGGSSCVLSSTGNSSGGRLCSIQFNPVFERALHGPGTAHGWNYEPALLLRWKRKSFSPSLEPYGEVESITVRPYAQPEVHQFFCGGDWQVTEIFKVNLGVGLDLTSRGPGLVLKSRWEWDWGARRNP